MLKRRILLSLCSLFIFSGTIFLYLRERVETSGFLVIQVIDGDTIFLENGEAVRYIGVDAPETQHPRRGLECFGPEATERNTELVGGKRVRLEADLQDRDRYGRLLRYVYVGDVFVNEVLIEEGYAYAYYFPPNTSHYMEFLQLELKAEKNGFGLWSACPH